MKVTELEILEKLFNEFRELRWCAQRSTSDCITFYLSKDWSLMLFTNPGDYAEGLALEIILEVGGAPIFRDILTSDNFTQDIIRFKFFMTALREAGRRFLN